MDIQVVTSLITSVGFPIATTIILAWYVFRQSEKHKEEIDKLSSAVVEQTIAMQKLIDKIEQILTKQN